MGNVEPGSTRALLLRNGNHSDEFVDAIFKRFETLSAIGGVFALQWSAGRGTKRTRSKEWR